MIQFDLFMGQVAIFLRWLVFKGYEVREMREYPTPSQAVQGFQLPPPASPYLEIGKQSINKA